VRSPEGADILLILVLNVLVLVNIVDPGRWVQIQRTLIKGGVS